MMATESSAAKETFHAFETAPSARAFLEVFGENPDNIIEGIGWQLGPLLPADAIVYLWPEKCDEADFKWIDDIAATTKATLKWPTVAGQPLFGWIRSNATKGDLTKAMLEAETVENFNERTDRDLLAEIKEKADAMTKAEYQAELRKNEIAVFESSTKYKDTEGILHGLAWRADERPLEYEHLRESQAQRLGVRVHMLDKLIEERRKPKEAEKPPAAKRPPSNANERQGAAIICPDVEPWPEPVDGAKLFNDISETLNRYVALPPGAADGGTLWIAHSHCFESFTVSPRLNITSPERGCGKTTLRDVIGLFVPRPFLAENLTTATAFRLVEEYSPVILADECDAWLKDNEELRGIINSGHRRGGYVPRCVGDKQELKAFKTYTPVVLCGIGALPGTLHDRSIVIRLERAKAGELQARFDSRHADKEKKLNRKLARWIADNRERIATCDPILPDRLCNRQADNWRPLFAIAKVAGGDWPKRCAEAFSKSNSGGYDTETRRVQLLTDLRQVFTSERMFSKDLIELLVQMTERPWAEVCRGKPINERWLARSFAAFGIHSKTLRIGEEQAKGYELADFAEVFERYLNQ